MPARTTSEPLQFGPLKGATEDVRLENPKAPRPEGAFRLFEGRLRDASGLGQHGAAEDATLVPAPAGQALGPLERPMRVPSSAALPDTPGIIEHFLGQTPARRGEADDTPWPVSQARA